MSHKHPFVDTNILVYAHDSDAAQKHVVAQRLVRALWDGPYPPAISTQVLQELYVSLLRKGASSVDCAEVISIYYPWEVVGHDVPLVQAAVSCKERYRISLWDALIVAAAVKAKAEILYTEDLQDGQRFDHVLVVNPFLVPPVI